MPQIQSVILLAVMILVLVETELTMIMVGKWIRTIRIAIQGRPMIAHDPRRTRITIILDPHKHESRAQCGLAS
jgi:hypothetical protein